MMAVTEAVAGRRTAGTSRPDRAAQHRKLTRAQRRVVVIAARIMLPIVFFGWWEHAANSKSINVFFYSQPSKVWAFLRKSLTMASTWDNLYVTMHETFVGFGIAAVAGIVAGLVFTLVPILHEIVRPFLTALNSLPRIALAPLFTVWFGLGEASKVALVISLCFFIVLSATMGAIGNIDPDLVRLARVLGFSRTKVFGKVMLPWAVPGLFAGLELALVYAFVGAIGAEMISSQKGVGQQIQLFSGQLNTAAVLGTLVLLAAVTTLFSLLMDLIRRRMLRYREDMMR